MINMKKLQITAVLVMSLLAAPQLMAATAFAGSDMGGGTDQNKCGDTKTQIVACDEGTKTGLSAINGLISMTIAVLSILVGIVAVGALSYAGIIYASAGDVSSQVEQAKTVVRNVVIGLVMYAFTIVIINWLVPGGIIATAEEEQQQNAQQSSQEKK